MKNNHITPEMLARLRAQHTTPTTDRTTPQTQTQTQTAPQTNKTTDTAQDDRQNKFAALLREWESAANLDASDPIKANALETLAQAVTQSVLKKLLCVGASPVINSLKMDIVRDKTLRSATAYATDHATKTRYTSGGDIITETDDPDMRDAVAKLTRECENDGTDLVSVAIVAILRETEKAIAEGRSDGEWMEREYTVRRLKKKVRIQSADSVDGWEDKTVTPIQAAFIAVRRAVEKTRSVQVASHKYTYLETVVTDDESGEKTVAYDRLPLYCNLVGEETDSNGRPTAVTAERSAYNKYLYLVEKMNLTDREMDILTYRVRGFGNKAIATRLGITENACKGATNRMRDKARKVGFQNDTLVKKLEREIPVTIDEISSDPFVMRYGFACNYIPDKNAERQTPVYGAYVPELGTWVYTEKHW